jgi:hypothetical protein
MHGRDAWILVSCSGFWILNLAHGLVVRVGFLLGELEELQNGTDGLIVF